MKKERNGHPVLSVEWLRTFKGFEDYSDERAKEALETVRSLAHILIDIHKLNSLKAHEQP
jgi:hypothetical protein